MRLFLPLLFLVHGLFAEGQYDRFSYRYNYAFIEDSSTLIPMHGNYRVEYLARGQWWSYMDPRTPVNYPGRPMQLKPVVKVNGVAILVVELERDYSTTDNKLRVVRGADTMIVDLKSGGDLEGHMLRRTANIGVPPRPPVLLPFRKGWFRDGELVEEARTVAHTARFDALWKSQRAAVIAVYDTARYVFSLATDDLRTGPLEIPILRDPNYTHHLLQFPACGPGTFFELYLQDSTGVPNTTMSLRVEMPPDGETSVYVDVSDLPYGKYAVHQKWAEEQTVFHLIFGW